MIKLVNIDREYLFYFCWVVEVVINVKKKLYVGEYGDKCDGLIRRF